jgi:cytochrome P450 family 110
MSLIPDVTAPKSFQLWQWITNPIKYLQNCDRQYGDTYAVQLSNLFKGVVFVSNPAAIQQLLTGDTKQFAALSDTNQLLRPFLGDRGTILLEGIEHKQRRQLVMPAFHGDKIRVYTDLIQQITRDLIQKWPLQSKINVREQMQSISLLVILQAVFGLYQGERLDLIQQKLVDVLEIFDSPLKSGLMFLPKLQQDWGPWSPWGKVQRDLAALDKLIYQEIADRRQTYESDQSSGGVAARTDILSLLIGSQDADGNGMNDQELRDELMTLLFAGHETTATALSWAIYWSNYLPEVQAKLLAEIATLGSERDITAINKLPYLGAFCSEVLRIHPVAILTFARVAQEAVSLQGYDIAPGTVVMGCIYQTHHRPDIYPDPDVFKPERFLERQFSPYEYVPFGGGSRRCIGLALAQMELKLVVVEILANCQLQLIDKLPIAPVRRGVTLAPQTGVNIKVVSKNI